MLHSWPCCCGQINYLVLLSPKTPDNLCDTHQESQVEYSVLHYCLCSPPLSTLMIDVQSWTQLLGSCFPAVSLKDGQAVERRNTFPRLMHPVRQ